MEQRQFEQAVLHLVYGSGVQRLTPASVAYHVGLGVKQAEKMLDAMVMEGTLDLDSDDDGNLFYYVRDAELAGVMAQNGPPEGPYGEAQGGPPQQGWPTGAHQGFGAPPHQGPWAGQQPPPGSGWPPAGGAPAFGAVPKPGMGGQGYSNINPPPQTGMIPHPGARTGQMQRYAPEPPKSPYTAALLSFFPGAGQLYNGQIGKALAFFFTSLVLYSVLPPLGLLTHVWAVIDAHATSRRSTPYGLLPP